MNTYKKYCPNVFVAKCQDPHEKGETIVLTTKYGKEHECIVFNQVGKDRDGSYYYSIVRADGYNAQERARAKAERLTGFADNADKRSIAAYEKSDLSEEKTGIPFGQPILVGHHSERRHRKIIDQAWNNMGKSVKEGEKAEEYRSRAEYWEAKASDINLSMPESLEYYEFKLEEAKNKHQDLKDNPEKREHSYSLTYAKKEVNETQKNLELAVKLWGSLEEANQMADEKKEAAEMQTTTRRMKISEKIKGLGGFFAFNNDQFREGYAKAVEGGHLEQGEKVTHIKAGLYMPSNNVQKYLSR